MTTDTFRVDCPECEEGLLSLHTDGLVGVLIHPGYHVKGTPLEHQMQARPFLACNACEFCIEVNLATQAVIPNPRTLR